MTVRGSTGSRPPSVNISIVFHGYAFGETEILEIFCQKLGNSRICIDIIKKLDSFYNFKNCVICRLERTYFQHRFLI